MASLMRSCLKGCACDAAPLTYRKYALSNLVRNQSRPTRRGGQGPQGHPRTLSRSVGPFERSVRCAPERKSTPAQVWIRVHNPLIALLAHGATHGAHPEVSAPVTSRRDRWELQVPPGIRERAVLAAQEAHKSAHALRDAEVRVHAVAREAAEAEAERLNPGTCRQTSPWSSRRRCRSTARAWAIYAVAIRSVLLHSRSLSSKWEVRKS